MSTDLHRLYRQRFISGVTLVLLLAAASGGIDVVAYLRYDVFVANQTGNLIIISLGITQGEQRDPVLPSVVSLAAFMLAVLITARIRRALVDRSVAEQQVRHKALITEAVLLVFAAAIIVVGFDANGDVRYGVIALLAASQGIQAVVLVRVLGVAVQTVAINGPLVSTLNLAAEGRRWRAIVAGAAPVGYAIGAGTGALLQIVSSGLTLVVSAALGIASVFVGGRYRELDARVTALEPPPAGQAPGG
jgi:uncharacterized membrane protein YoaK (UPF0700 family)